MKTATFSVFLFAVLGNVLAAPVQQRGIDSMGADSRATIPMASPGASPPTMASDPTAPQANTNDPVPPVVISDIVVEDQAPTGEAFAPKNTVLIPTSIPTTPRPIASPDAPSSFAGAPGVDATDRVVIPPPSLSIPSSTETIVVPTSVPATPHPIAPPDAPSSFAVAPVTGTDATNHHTTSLPAYGSAKAIVIPSAATLSHSVSFPSLTSTPAASTIPAVPHDAGSETAVLVGTRTIEPTRVPPLTRSVIGVVVGGSAITPTPLHSPISILKPSPDAPSSFAVAPATGTDAKNHPTTSLSKSVSIAAVVMPSVTTLSHSTTLRHHFTPIPQAVPTSTHPAPHDADSKTAVVIGTRTTKPTSDPHQKTATVNVIGVAVGGSASTPPHLHSLISTPKPTRLMEPTRKSTTPSAIPTPPPTDHSGGDDYLEDSHKVTKSEKHARPHSKPQDWENITPESESARRHVSKMWKGFAN